MIDFLVFIVGLFWGSFLALMTYRIPKGISIIHPRSFCDKCERKLKIIDNLPIVSYLFLKGKCRYCSSKISIKYIAIEIVTGLMFWFAYNFLYYDIYTLVKAVVFISVIVPSTFIDLEHRIIPDRFSIGLVIFGLIFSFFDPNITWLNSLSGIIVGGGTLFLVSLAYYKMTGKEGLGGGDIKLLAGLGAMFGWQASFAIIFYSSILGSIYGLFLILIYKKGRYTEIAFGPFIAIASIFYFFIIEGGFFG
jgi:leader peptidase (prepilin peptidase) / N-methyltransferase